MADIERPDGNGKPTEGQVCGVWPSQVGRTWQKLLKTGE